jgi:hypothetical protein
MKVKDLRKKMKEDLIKYLEKQIDKIDKALAEPSSLTSEKK